MSGCLSVSWLLLSVSTQFRNWLPLHGDFWDRVNTMALDSLLSPSLFLSFLPSLFPSYLFPFLLSLSLSFPFLFLSFFILLAFQRFLIFKKSVLKNKLSPAQAVSVMWVQPSQGLNCYHGSTVTSMFPILFGTMTTRVSFNVPPTLKSLSFSTFPTFPHLLLLSLSSFWFSAFLYPCRACHN